LTPHCRLLEYCVTSQHLVAYRSSTSSSSATFKFRSFLGPPTYSFLRIPNQVFVCMSYFSSVAERQYSPSITATFISVYCLLHFLAFVGSHFLEIQVRKGRQKKYNHLGWYFFKYLRLQLYENCICVSQNNIMVQNVY
jgi:hypothetical protein